LASRDLRRLSFADLRDLETLASDALHRDDDGYYLFDLDAEPDEHGDQLNERDDLSRDEREWIDAVLGAVWDEQERRERRERRVMRRRNDPLVGGVRRLDKLDRQIVRARPRERRARAVSSSSSAGGRDRPRRSSDDEPDPPWRALRPAGARPDYVDDHRREAAP
jgi:hypothetical protein